MPEETALSAETPSTQEPSQRFGESQAGEHAQGAPDSAGNGHREPVQTPSQKAKELSRYERTKRERAAFKASQAEFSRQREAFARERAEFEARQKPRRDYTVEDLKKYRNQWENEGNFELVEKADKEIAAMEAEQQALKASRTVELPPVGTPEHRAQWEAAERELAQADPEFMRDGTRLDARLREIMGSEDGNIYRQHPRGIVAAYHRAKMDLSEGENKELRTRISKLEQELQRYTGLTSIGGGAPARLGGSSRVESIEDFSKLSLADMQKHLKRGVKRGGTPWF